MLVCVCAFLWSYRRGRRWVVPTIATTVLVAPIQMAIDGVVLVVAMALVMHSYTLYRSDRGSRRDVGGSGSILR